MRFEKKSLLELRDTIEYNTRGVNDTFLYIKFQFRRIAEKSSRVLCVCNTGTFSTTVYKVKMWETSSL